MKLICDIGKKLVDFVKDEVVLAAAAVLAVVSMFLVTPDKEYVSYIDYRVLGLLFSLMVVMAGLQELGFFKKVAAAILKRVRGYRGLCFVAVSLCFFSSMLITNDVALITFVPLTILLLKMAGMEDKMTIVIVLQTIGANLGSMLTPIGNPQNLYLYAVSGMSLVEFLAVMGPLTAVSFVLLCLSCLFQKNCKMAEISLMGDAVDQREGTGEDKKTENITTVSEKSDKGDENSKKGAKVKTAFIFFGILFVLSLLSVLRVIHFLVPLTVAVIGTFFVRRHILKQVDYNLLLTFVCFFVFIGNVGRIEGVRMWLENLIGGRELIVGFLSSQVISNVPACILLSGFTENWNALLMGVNIGGLGTLIASLASLISYKFFAREQPAKKGKYMIVFTLMNVVFAVVLLGVALW